MSKRQKQVYPSDEIAHLWYHKAQESARSSGSGNFYFAGDTIYSYGGHFPIARHVTAKSGAAAVLFTTRGCSNTTARHISMTRRAIPSSARVARVFDVERPDRTPESHSTAAGESIDKLIGKLKAIAAPPAKLPALKRVELKFNIGDGSEQPIKALGGKRLAIHKAYSYWNLSHIRSGKAIETHINTELAARQLVVALDKYKVWDEIPSGGKASREVLDKAYKLVSAARKKINVHAEKVNRHPSVVAKLYRTLESEVQALNKFNEFFGIRKRYKIPAGFDSLRETTEQHEAESEARRRQRWAEWDLRHAAAREAARKKEAEFQEKLPEYCERWRNGEYVPELDGRRYYSGVPTMLRISGDEVETSRGARFPVAHAKRGLEFARRLKAEGKTYQRNGHSIHLGHYVIDSIDADGTIRAGCHTVTWDEVEQIAPKLDAVQEGSDQGN